MLHCAFPYLANEAMSYLKEKGGWMEEQHEEGTLQREKERKRERERERSQCLPPAPGSLSSQTDSCIINMSEQRSRADHGRLQQPPTVRPTSQHGGRRGGVCGGGGDIWEYPSSSPSGLNSQQGRPPDNKMVHGELLLKEQRFVTPPSVASSNNIIALQSLSIKPDCSIRPTTNTSFNHF